MIETKEKILLGMLDLVAETGLEKASIGRLCKKIKVSPGNVYFYFSSKVELLNTLYYYCINSLIEAVDIKTYTEISKDEECTVYTTLRPRVGFYVLWHQICNYLNKINGYSLG